MRWLSLGILLTFFTSYADAQTGFPLWGTFETSTFDAVNRQNLNVNFSIPLVSTPSRAGSFNYALVYNSLIWTKNGTAWSPVDDGNGNLIWGWRDNQPLGATTFTHANIFCDTQPPTSSPHWNNYKYTDGGGTVHKFPLNFYSVATACQFPTGPTTAYAIDGSGYFIDASSPSGPIVYSASGDKITGTRTDRNGNYVSGIVVSGSETDFKDTKGKVTVKKIKVSSTQTQYKLLDQTGSYTNVSATATYAAFNIKTHFACSGVSEYTATGIYLITQLLMPNGHSYLFTYEDTPGFSGYKTGRLKKVVLPTGGYYQYDYPTTGNNGINCADGSVTSLTRTVNDGSSNVWQFTGGGGQTSEVFPQMPYDTASNTWVFTFSGGKLTQQKAYQGGTGGALLRTVNIIYASNGTPASTVTILEDGSRQAKVETDFDTNANLTEQREYDWGPGSPGSLLRRTTYTYLTGSAYTTANILNRVKTVVTKDGAGIIKARTDIGYDNYGSNMTCVTGALQHNDGGYGCSFTARGNPTSIVRYTDPITPAGGVTTNLYYDSLGNVVKTDVNGVIQQQSTFSSVTQWVSPDSITLGPSSGSQVSTSATYNSNTGLLASSTDANSQITFYTYDALRRLTDVQRPDSAHITYAYDDVNNTTSQSIPVQGASVIRQTNYLDSLGRIYKTVAADVNNVTYSIIESKFDPLGRQFKTSNPHNSTAQYWTELDSDSLGRVTKQILPDGNQNTNNYALNTTIAADAAGNQIQSTLDGLGRLVQINEPDVNNGNALTIATSYTYDVFDNIIQVSQGAETRAFAYDALGEQTSVTLPETGQVQYQYNAFGQVTQRTDARGVITTYSYDTLNRPYQIIYNVGTTGVPATPTVTFAYGVTPAQFNNGRLISLTSSGVETDSFTYDQLGRVSNLSKNIIGAPTYNLGYSYNLANQVATLTYPSGRVVTNSYDTIGRLLQIADGTPRTYISQFSYNPAQQTLGYTMGNGIQGTFSFSDSRLQLGTLAYQQSGTSLFSLGYGYTQPNSGNNGQITSIADNLTAANSLTFTYDALNRLSRGKTSSLTAPNTWDISWVYDRYGNRTNQTLNGGTLAVASSNLTFNTQNQPTGGFSFDLSGNTLDDGVTHNYVYDAENRYVTLGTTLVNTYDAASLRVEKITSGSTTVYVFSGSQVIAEYSPSASVTAPSKEYIYAGTQLLATLDSSHTPTYRNTDHLSVRLFTDANGNVIGTQGHLPFGDQWYSAGTVDKWKFTTYERDTDTSLDYARMRFDSARLARFTSPDPYLPSADPAVPQSWNRYTYVQNSPTVGIDALGLRCTIFVLGVHDNKGLFNSIIDPLNPSAAGDASTYPFAGMGLLGGVASALFGAVGTDSQGLTSLLNQYQGEDGGVDLVGWSGGAQVIGNVDSSHPNLFNNVTSTTYLSPGLSPFFGATLYQASDSMAFRGSGIVDFATTLDVRAEGVHMVPTGTKGHSFTKEFNSAPVQQRLNSLQGSRGPCTGGPNGGAPGGTSDSGWGGGWGFWTGENWTREGDSVSWGFWGWLPGPQLYRLSPY